MASVEIAAINLDCDDPGALAAFWARLLGGELVMESPDFCAVQAGPLVIGAVRVDDHRRPTWPSVEVPQQIHLDLRVDGLESAVEEALRLGASDGPKQFTPERSRVLLDPAGHTFCLRA